MPLSDNQKEFLRATRETTSGIAQTVSEYADRGCKFGIKFYLALATVSVGSTAVVAAYEIIKGNSPAPLPSVLEIYNTAASVLGQVELCFAAAAVTIAIPVALRRRIAKGPGKLIKIGKERYTKRTAEAHYRDLLMKQPYKSKSPAADFMRAILDSKSEGYDAKERKYLLKDISAITAQLIGDDLSKPAKFSDPHIFYNAIAAADIHPAILQDVTPAMFKQYIEREAGKEHSALIKGFSSYENQAINKNFFLEAIQILADSPRDSHPQRQLLSELSADAIDTMMQKTLAQIAHLPFQVDDKLASLQGKRTVQNIFEYVSSRTYEWPNSGWREVSKKAKAVYKSAFDNRVEEINREIVADVAKGGTLTREHLRAMAHNVERLLL